jgi:hypothetical protein
MPARMPLRQQRSYKPRDRQARDRWLHHRILHVATGALGTTHWNEAVCGTSAQRRHLKRWVVQPPFAERHRARHGLECERDLWRPGGHRLQRPLRLHLLSSAVCVQSVRRSGTLRAAFRQRPFGPRLEGSAGTSRGPVSGQVQAPLLSRRCRLCEPGGLRVFGGRRV